MQWGNNFDDDDDDNDDLVLLRGPTSVSAHRWQIEDDDVFWRWSSSVSADNFVVPVSLIF